MATHGSPKHQLQKGSVKSVTENVHDRLGVTLSPLQPHSVVKVHHPEGRWSTRAKVLKEAVPRSYMVQTKQGAVLRRNR